MAKQAVQSKQLLDIDESIISVWSVPKRAVSGCLIFGLLRASPSIFRSFADLCSQRLRDIEVPYRMPYQEPGECQTCE